MTIAAGFRKKLSLVLLLVTALLLSRCTSAQKEEQPLSEAGNTGVPGEEAGRGSRQDEAALFLESRIEAVPFSPVPLLPSLPSLAYPCQVYLKSGPEDILVSRNGTELIPAAEDRGLRQFTLSDDGAALTFSRKGFITKEIRDEEIPGLLRNGILQVKLEPENGFLKAAGETASGIQPKSAFFSPDGKRVFVPLLGDAGIDVFAFSAETGNTEFEKRLTVPGSSAKGFVEALADEKRRELWVSNMEEHRVHIFDLDSLEYKSSVPTGGIMPKVIAQNPAGTLIAVSNWQSRNISIIDPDTKKLRFLIPLGGTPRGMAFSSDGSLLYAAIFDEAVVEEVDMAKRKVSRRFRFHEGSGAARHIIYKAGRLYVSDMARGTVNILNAADGAVLRSLRTGPNINTIALSPDGTLLFASSRGRNNPEDYTIPGPDLGTVTVLDAGNLSILDRVWGGNQPTGLALSPDGGYMVFTNFLDANMEIYRIER
ncbi:hypothetical protein LJC14_01080 [Treponema sp. OttesenSCG-928-L16]|nr:hypothetical protein [Treponema sp. OttesenSCG-928-L16]